MKNNKYDILVIDDEEVILDSIERICREENLKTHRAGDVSEAIKKLKEFNYKIILCDIMLPEQDGFYFLEFFQKTISRFTPVIMTTGYSTVENAVLSLQKGAIDFLPKPFTADELFGSISRGLNYVKITEELFSEQKNQEIDSVVYVPCPPKYLRLGLNSWIYKEYDGTVVVGVTDLFLKMIDSAKDIYLNRENDEIIQGHTCARIVNDTGLEHSILSPVSGRIIEYNQILPSNTDIIEKDPYFNGWLYRILPSNYGYEIKYLTSCSIDMLL